MSFFLFAIKWAFFTFLSYYLGKVFAKDIIENSNHSINKKQAVTIGYFIFIFLILCGVAAISASIANSTDRYFIFQPDYKSAFFNAMFFAYIFYWSIKENSNNEPSNNKEIKNVDTINKFELASKIASSIEGFISSGGKINEKTKIFINEKGVGVGEINYTQSIFEIQMNNIDKFDDLIVSVENGVLLRPTIDSYAVSVIKQLGNDN